MSDVAIRVENLGKRYRIGVQEERQDTLVGAMLAFVKRPGRNLQRLRRLTRFSANGMEEKDVVWALRDVSFEVKQGEVVGVIGRNGAGKSTLLKVLSRITYPTTGRIELHGRVSSLLEVGTGFHPELTGRENVYLNGTILGMRKKEIDRKFDEIVDFSGVEKFIDTPVKYYSSGMRVRLAFSVAAYLEPEILLVDEVLAVGDVEFQRKCLGKMGEISEAGRTVMFVSHSMEAVQRLCNRCIWFNHGQIALDGATLEVASSYLIEHRGYASARYLSVVPDQTPDHEAMLIKAEILNAKGEFSEHLHYREPFSIRMLWNCWHNWPFAAIAIRVYDSHDRFLFAVNTLDTNLILQKGSTEIICCFDPNVLVPGVYLVSIGLYVRPHKTIHLVDSCLKFSVIDISYESNNKFSIIGNPLFAPRSQWVFRNV